MSLDPEHLIGRSVGGFTIEELIGSGTFAWVFKANGAGQTVALKVLRPRYAGEQQFEVRFRNEFQIASELIHPNIVNIEAVGQDRGVTYFAMDYCPDSLASIVERRGPLLEHDLVAVASHMAAALAFAHDAGIVHRDIKPDNILRASDGRWLLADFGIARTVSDYVTATGASMTIGTPHYISPEQAQGHTLDGRSDLYSLGVTLYKAATGSLPFRSTDWFELARMHVEDRPESPRARRPDLNARLDRVILKLMAKDPDDRYPSAAALGVEVSQVPEPSRDTHSFGRVPDAGHRKAPSAHTKTRWLLRLAALVVVAVVAVVVVLLGRR